MNDLHFNKFFRLNNAKKYKKGKFKGLQKKNKEDALKGGKPCYISNQTFRSNPTSSGAPSSSTYMVAG